jgi:hypothetical protein
MAVGLGYDLTDFLLVEVTYPVNPDAQEAPFAPGV